MFCEQSYLYFGILPVMCSFYYFFTDQFTEKFPAVSGKISRIHFSGISTIKMLTTSHVFIALFSFLKTIFLNNCTFTAYEFFS